MIFISIFAFQRFKVKISLSTQTQRIWISLEMIFRQRQENVLVPELLLTKMIIHVFVMLTFLQSKTKMTPQPVNVCVIIC